MSYGLEIYNSDGELQFNSNDPAIYLQATGFPNFTAGLVQVQKIGSSFFYRDNGFPKSSTDFFMVRPASNESGMVGIARWSGNTYAYRPYSWKLGAGGMQFDPIDFNYQTFRDISELTDDGGYGLSCFDASGNLTFTTNPSGNFLAYADFVKIVPRGTTYTASSLPGQAIYTAPSAEAWDNTYVVLHNHEYEMIATAAPGTTLPLFPDGTPFSASIAFAANSYYFDHPTRTIYACQFSYNGAGFENGVWWDIDNPPSPNILGGTMSYPSTFQRDYFVIQGYTP
jgi:hypothetical protein